MVVIKWLRGPRGEVGARRSFLASVGNIRADSDPVAGETARIDGRAARGGVADLAVPPKLPTAATHRDKMTGWAVSFCGVGRNCKPNVVP